jgi:hypothetical protein
MLVAHQGARSAAPIAGTLLPHLGVGTLGLNNTAVQGLGPCVQYFAPSGTKVVDSGAQQPQALGERVKTSLQLAEKLRTRGLLRRRRRWQREYQGRERRPTQSEFQLFVNPAACLQHRRSALDLCGLVIEGHAHQGRWKPARLLRPREIAEQLAQSCLSLQ